MLPRIVLSVRGNSSAWCNYIVARCWDTSDWLRSLSCVHKRQKPTPTDAYPAAQFTRNLLNPRM